jgi:hypothetical protein
MSKSSERMSFQQSMDSSDRFKSFKKPNNNGKNEDSMHPKNSQEYQAAYATVNLF